MQSQKVCVVGGGIAGLTTALELAENGISVDLYEASERFGGRIMTYTNFYKGMFAEYGGELIDDTHKAIIDLVKRLKEKGYDIELEEIKPQGTEDLFFADGKWITCNEMYDPETGNGFYAELRTFIFEDAKELHVDGKWTAKAKKLDAISIDEYLEDLSNKVINTPDWVFQLLKNCYVGEIGSDTIQQSALNFITYIGSEPDLPFRILGDSSETLRIKGGNQVLIDAIVKELVKINDSSETKVTLHNHHHLTKVEKRDGGSKLTFKVGGEEKKLESDQVVFALPVKVLAQLDGMEKLCPDKIDAIKSLGCGKHLKVSMPLKNAPWMDHEFQNGIGVCPNGVFYVARTEDGKFRHLQNLWCTNRTAYGHAVITFLIGGSASEENPGEIIKQVQQEFAEIFGKSPENIFDLEAVISAIDWAKHAFSGGMSYTAPKPGQFTTTLGDMVTPPATAGVYFAGEEANATEPQNFGYMDAAVGSAIRTAKIIVDQAKYRAAESTLVKETLFEEKNPAPENHK